MLQGWLQKGILDRHQQATMQVLQVSIKGGQAEDRRTGLTACEEGQGQQREEQIPKEFLRHANTELIRAAFFSWMSASHW